MRVNPLVVLGCSILYLLGLFGLAELVDRGRQGGSLRRFARHPVVAALTMCVYATSWTYYGTAGFARARGMQFLTIYLGVTIACALTPVIWIPLLRLVRAQSLGSPADLLAFRYRHPWTGPLVTIFTLAGSLPYLAQQIQAVSSSLSAISGVGHTQLLGFGFCAIVAPFSAFLGARHVGGRQRHDGLAAAIAVESGVKLVALALVGGFAFFGVLGGPAGVARYLSEHPEALEALQAPARAGPWDSLLLLSGAAAFLLPRQFHVAFVESPGPGALRTASWLLPLYLLLLNLPIIPILWAGTRLSPTGEADFYVLTVAQATRTGWMPLVAFVGGLSAASSMMAVTCLALASMCLNHLVLPLRRPDPARDLYRGLITSRRILVALMVLAGFTFFLLLERHEALAQLGLISFVAVAQFLPGTLALLFWPRANTRGFLTGLGAGISIWAVLLIWPLFQPEAPGRAAAEVAAALGMGGSVLAATTFLSLTVNIAIFASVSLIRDPQASDLEAARECARPLSMLRRSGARSPEEMTALLAPFVGDRVARAEVELARRSVGLNVGERRPAHLGQLHAAIERGISGLLGPPVGRRLVDSAFQLDERLPPALTDRLLELELSTARTPLSGTAGEAEALRRYFRGVLQELPLGICAIGPRGEVVLWNASLAQLSGWPADEIVGLPMKALAEPWGGLLNDGDPKPSFARELRIMRHGKPLWLLVHHTELDAASGQVTVIQDLTAHRVLEAQVAHQDRLASVGRLAAGIAHEVGNPLAGIALVAQNLRAEQPGTDVAERASQILQQSQRIDRIIRALMSFSRADGELNGRVAEQVTLADAIHEAVELVRLGSQERGLKLEESCAAALTVTGDHARLVQLFVNLLANGCDASPSGSTVAIDGALDRSHQTARVAISDRGPGIPDDIRARVFEPFFTTKAPGKGTGLGLPVALSIAREHGGTISLETDAGRGTVFLVTLPIESG
jgi:PAS domain S-box-containing protein